MSSVVTKALAAAIGGCVERTIENAHEAGELTALKAANGRTSFSAAEVAAWSRERALARDPALRELAEHKATQEAELAALRDQLNAYQLAKTKAAKLSKEKAERDQRIAEVEVQNVLREIQGLPLLPVPEPIKALPLGAIEAGIDELLGQRDPNGQRDRFKPGLIRKAEVALQRTEVLTLKRRAEILQGQIRPLIELIDTLTEPAASAFEAARQAARSFYTDAGFNGIRDADIGDGELPTMLDPGFEIRSGTESPKRDKW